MTRVRDRWTLEQQLKSEHSLLEADDPAYEPNWKQQARQLVRLGQACPECLGLEWVRDGEHPVGHIRFGELIPCPTCTKGRLSEYLRRASGLIGWQARARFADYIQADARTDQLKHAQELVNRGYGWLTLWGQYGTSKTFLLAAIVNECLEAKRPAVYITAGRLLDHLRDAYSPQGVGFSAAFSNWANCQVLAIDEADTFHETSWAMDKYRQLLEHRYNLACARDGITAFASNLQPGGEGWPASLAWLASRMTQFAVVEARGGDIRPVIGGEGYTPWQDKFD